MKVLDLVGDGFSAPTPKVASRSIQPFVLVSDELDRSALEKILGCDDFDSIGEVSHDCNHEVTSLAVFYTE